MYKQPFPHLFKPIKLRGLTIKNRIMSAPNMLFHTVDGRPTDYYISYLEHKARGGAGIVNLGEVCVCDGGNHTPWTMPTLDNMPLYGEMAAAIHEHGAAASVELTHGGMNARMQYNNAPLLGPVDAVGASGNPIKAMTKEDMASVANAFAETAAYFRTAGFDTVLLHMAHGWLFTQFFSPFTNTRSDEFGGSFENRMRFPLMVIKAVRERVGPDFPIMLRVSGSERRPGGFSVSDITSFLEKAQEYADLAEISTENLTMFFATTYMPLAQNLDLASDIKASGKVHIPIYTVGSILSPSQAEEIIAAGKADGVSMSRALIADPYLPKKAALGLEDEIVPCLRCLNCTDSDNASRHFVCSVNPLIGREARLGFAENIIASEPKNVLVVGGGPAGMTAAITASRRGHKVTLCEKNDKLGGLLSFTQYESLKHDLKKFNNYLIRCVLASNVKLLLNSEVNDELIEIMRPDHIIVATGSSPVIPASIKRIDKARHVTEAYSMPLENKNIVIIGGGLSGVECGLHLAASGNKVTVLEMRDDYAVDAKAVLRIGIMRKVSELALNIICSARCVELTDNGVVYEKDGEFYTAPADSVFYAAGMTSNDNTYFELYDKAPFVSVVGDCKKVGKVDGAVHSGYFAALDI